MNQMALRTPAFMLLCEAMPPRERSQTKMDEQHARNTLSRCSRKQASEYGWQTLDNQYVRRLDFRDSVSYQIVEGLPAFPEPGVLPEGLAVYEFDDDEPPQPILDKDALRTGVWELMREVGDSSLRL
jgi:hypothetical protein